jgi:hypothetical protein
MNNARRLIAVLVSAGLSLTVVVPSVAAASLPSIANTKCTKSGQKRVVKKVSYTCTKKGKSLLWVAAARATGTKPTAPVAPAVAYLETQLAALRSRASSAAASSLVSSRVDPALASSTWAADSVTSIASALKMLAALDAAPNKSATVYVSKSRTWVAPFTPAGCSLESAGAFCEPNVIITNIGAVIDAAGGSERAYGSLATKLSIVGNTPHEIAHLAQSSVAERAGNSGVAFLRPNWMREGGAEMFRVLWFAYDNGLTYKESRDLFAARRKRANDTRCNSVGLAELAGTNSSHPTGCEYDDGFLAMEYLVWKTQNVRAEHIFTERATGSTAAQAFQSVFGFSLNDFHTEADAYIAKELAAL